MGAYKRNVIVEIKKAPIFMGAYFVWVHVILTIRYYNNYCTSIKIEPQFTISSLKQSFTKLKELVIKQFHVHS